ncbi:unnamed protein product [Medioppia subpectinata]|uniref:FAD/NAD(P)-binding domain-containing protein n=1 Tax=Medioppia subpectinata TaxID=1979941 RepID=A0A7R9Q0Q4_9ACAR|nr:unnamed protein product [Medioppia subpectinata]CAG2107785.1 unnamed protein product [Medioppia subpectinata]
MDPIVDPMDPIVDPMDPIVDPMDPIVDPMDPIVVIGGGIGGVECCQQLAQQLPQRAIVLISSSDMIKVSTVRRIGQTMDELNVSEESHHYLCHKYDNIAIICDQVMSLSASAHSLSLKSGQTVRYDKLCVCLGAKPKMIEMQDSVKDRNRLSDYILVIRDTQTVHELHNRLKSCQRVVIVGNGGIATELVHQIVNCQLIWCMKDESMGAPYFDAMAAQFLSNRLNAEPQDCTADDCPNISKRLNYRIVNIEQNVTQTDQPFGAALGPDWSQMQPMVGSIVGAKNVTIEANCEAKSIYDCFESIDISKKPFIYKSEETNDWPVFVELTNDAIYGCDLIICATGVVPNTAPILEGNHFHIGSDGGLKVRFAT